MLLRGSSWLTGSGSRVSAMPPAPILGPSPEKTTTLVRGLTAAGAKAEALATRAARTINLEDCAYYSNMGCKKGWKEDQDSKRERRMDQFTGSKR
jgi:hypothetical protein